ncbi:DUF6932 family protein [uncultured Methanobrevibacter sp.]|uniref:DUF6932 family protein n=1 Tax=uncultured Methanobrevibacter sp. TaxID=253161 RepID=UPI0025F9FB0D|nr:nucleotidyltransferase domain-containing protein [uncultured Methanobrevibacter sp.]
MAKDNLPPFDERGCLPEGIYNPSVEDFMERFVKVTERRKELFGKYQQFTKLCNDAKGIEEHYLDGSYVTDKEAPNDIDLLILFNKEVYESDETYEIYFEMSHDQKKMKEVYEMHAFFVEKPQDSDPVEIRVNLQHEIDKIKGWWSRFYLDEEKTILDEKPKGFILFDKEQLGQIGE